MAGSNINSENNQEGEFRKHDQRFQEKGSTQFFSLLIITIVVAITSIIVFMVITKWNNFGLGDAKNIRSENNTVDNSVENQNSTNDSGSVEQEEESSETSECSKADIEDFD